MYLIRIESFVFPDLPHFTNTRPVKFEVYDRVKTYIEDVTRWRGDMNFMFEWQEQYLTSERSE